MSFNSNRCDYSSSNVGAPDVSRCFNSNRCDYSIPPSSCLQPPEDVSIPTGAITVKAVKQGILVVSKFQFQQVRLQYGGIGAGLSADGKFQFQQVRLQYTKYRDKACQRNSFNSNRCDYSSHTHSLSDLTQSFQFQQVRLQSQ